MDFIKVHVLYDYKSSYELSAVDTTLIVVLIYREASFRMNSYFSHEFYCLLYLSFEIDIIIF